MAQHGRGAVLRQIRALFDAGAIGSLTDGQLLERFTTRDGEAAELAFAALVERHGPMVLRTCRAILRDPNDADDAFQATFLVLARRAGALWVRGSLGAWLHQTAHRTASCVRSAALRRRRHEEKVAGRTRPTVRSTVPDDLGEVLHDELVRLPEPFRAAVVLCLVEGLTHEQAARRLGWPIGTVESRLARGRERLRVRLIGRGLAPTVGAIAAAVSAGRGVAAVPSALAESTVRAALPFSAGQAAGAEAVSAGVLALVEGMSGAMSMTMMKMAGAVVLAVGLAATGAGVWASHKDRAGQGGVPSPPARRSTEHAPAVVARVNGTPITRDELIEWCLEKHGERELESLIILKVLRQECERRGITVTDDEVEAELERMTTRNGTDYQSWLRVIEGQRGWSKDAYLREVIYPRVALGKLAGVEPGASSKELRRKAHVEVFFDRPRDRGQGVQKAPAHGRSQEERLRAVERTLEQMLKARESLKRDGGR